MAKKKESKSSSSSNTSESPSQSTSSSSFEEPVEKKDIPMEKKEVKNKHVGSEGKLIYEGKAGLCGMYEYKITDEVIYSTEIRGFLFVILMAIVGLVLTFLIALIWDVQQADPGAEIAWEKPILSGLFGMAVFLAIGLIFGIKKQKDVMEVSNISDMTFIQNCFGKKNGKGKIQFLSVDPTTPLLVARIKEDGEGVFHKMIEVIDNMRRAELDNDIEVEKIFDDKYGKVCCTCCGCCWGCCPQRAYEVTNHNIVSETACCCKREKNNIRMTRVYDLQLSQSCLQFCAPKCLPCCKFCPMFHKANISVFSFDRGDKTFSMKLADGEEKFQKIVPWVEAQQAADKYFLENKLNLQISGQFNQV